MNRRTSIPLTSLVLITTAGCSRSVDDDPMIGNWDCTSMAYVTGPVGDPCPQTYGGVYGDARIYTTYAYGLDIASETEASWVALHVYDYSSPTETYVETDIYSYSATITVVSKGNWLIETDAIDFDCTATPGPLEDVGDTMACTGTFYDEEVTMTFGPAIISRVAGRN